MQSPQEYLARTKSAVQHLFSSANSYLEEFRKAPAPVFSGSFPDERERDAALNEWFKKNAAEIRQSLDAQREFVAEKYALAALSGSILQIAAMAIRLYSRNADNFAGMAAVLNRSATPFCIGRHVRGVPLGLVILAGRNQYNHIDDDQLREPNVTIFEWLATNHTYGEGIRDPAFDLSTRTVWNYASNITSIVGWNSYDNYEADLRAMLIHG